MSDNLAVYYVARDSRTIVAVVPEEYRRLSVVRPETFGRAVALSAKLRGDKRYFDFASPEGPTAVGRGEVILDFYPGCGVTSAEIVAGLGYRVRTLGYCLIDYADYPLRRSDWLPADETAIGPEGTVDGVEAIAWLARA
jgi:hypothetical protein